MSSPAQMVMVARQAAGLTQRSLAARAGTSAAAINRYERGRSRPDLETLARVLAACGFELQLTMRPLLGAGGGVAAEDQPARDRRAIASAVAPDGEGQGWVRTPASRPSR
jgi:transcriptional regulator with XRE-family HTH domain